MASGPGVGMARQMLDMALQGGGTIRLWKVAPDYDGFGGTESVPAGGSPTISFLPAQAGTGGQIAKASGASPPVFPGVPDPSTAVVALSIHDPADDSIIAIDRDWHAPGAGWSAGDSPMFPVSVPFVPAS